ncbi:MAG: sugar phosphate isomerase/epimerase [Acidobacteria bacterium]|nr:sugar phosphate isomerase/epimerase [Acidobacteriota bacterium]
MLLGAVTYNILKDWDVEKIIKELETAGFQAVELRTTHAHKVEPSLSAAEREKVKVRFERSKVRLLSYGTVAEFHSPDAAVRAKHVADAKSFIDLAHDTGAWGIKVRPNGLPKEVSPETTIGNIGAALQELGEYGQGKGVEVWVEVHGRETQVPTVCARIMQAAKHSNVGLCWNSNPTDIENGSVKKSFDLLRPWIKNVHINELAGPYPYRELFRLLRESKYDRYALCEAQESKEPERFLRWYAALWRELNRA